MITTNLIKGVIKVCISKNEYSVLLGYRVSKGHRDADQMANGSWLFILRMEKHMQKWLGVCITVTLTNKP